MSGEHVIGLDGAVQPVKKENSVTGPLGAGSKGYLLES